MLEDFSRLLADDQPVKARVFVGGRGSAAAQDGLSARVWTNDRRRLMAAAAGLNFGEISCNRSNRGQVEGFHSGWGLSGLGGEDGKHGFDGYLRKKPM